MQKIRWTFHNRPMWWFMESNEDYKHMKSSCGLAKAALSDQKKACVVSGMWIRGVRSGTITGNFSPQGQSRSARNKPQASHKQR